MRMDALPYQTYKRIKDRFVDKMILITDEDLGRPGNTLAFKTHRDYVNHLFKKEGIEITCWQHDYESLSGPNPQLGVVFLANDSVIVPGMEAHVLIGHNARYINAGGDTV